MRTSRCSPHFTYSLLWQQVKGKAANALNIMERTMREVARRTKRIGASWGDVGLLAILKFLLKRYFDRQGYEEAWRRHYNPGACHATLISEAVKS